MSKMSMKGLANIGVLLATATAHAAEQVRADSEKSDISAIIEKTVGNIRYVHNAHMTAEQVMKLHEHNRTVITAAIREAVKLGHGAAIGQNEAVEVALARQYETKAAMLMPAVVAAIMEQIGTDKLVINLDAVATVFERVRVEYDTEVGSEFIEYKLVLLSEIES